MTDPIGGDRALPDSRRDAPRRRPPGSLRALAARTILAVESAGGRGLGWLWLLFGWILARNLLEGVLERPRTLGFDWREDVSAAMVFLHFPLFYLTLFAAVALWLHWIGRRPLGAAARATALGFGVLPLAPLIDAAISRGAGYDLKYLLGIGSTLWRFWDPRAPLTDVSPGQRVEIVLACLLAGAYAAAARGAGRRGGRDDPSDGTRAGSAARPLAPEASSSGAAAVVGRFAAAAAGVYLLAALAGAWPSLYARWLASAPSAEEAYRLAFRGPGLIASESRRHAVVIALPLLALLPLLAWRADPARSRPLLARLPWTRLLYYAGLVPAGVVVGQALYREFLPLHGPLGLYGPSDLAAIAVLTAAMAFAVLAAICWNDLADLEADRVNDPRRPLPSGLLEPTDVSRTATACAVAAAFLALCVAYVAFLLVLASLFLAWTYSTRPLRLKRWPFVATATLGSLSLLSAMAGVSLFGQENTPWVFPGRLALALFLGVTLGFQAKDLKDRDGDRATRVVTLATLLRPPRDRIVIAACVALAYLQTPLVLPLGWPIVAISATFALVGVAATLRLRRPDSFLLAAFCVFAAGALALIARHPQPLLGRAPRFLIEGHAAVLQGDPRAADAPLRRSGLHQAVWAERLAWLTARGENWPDARSAACRLSDLRPLDPQPFQRRVEIELSRGDGWKARQSAMEAVSLGLRPGWFLRQSAAAAVIAAETSVGSARAEARTQLERPETVRAIRGAALLLADPSPAFIAAGDRLRLLGKPEEAERAYAHAAATGPANADAWASLGESRHAAGRLEEAVAALRRARSLRPDDAWIRNNLGVALRDAGRAAEARAELEEARRLAPHMFEPLYNLALIAEREGRRDEARALARSAWGERPGFPPAEELIQRLEVDPSRTWPRSEDSREMLEPKRRRAREDSAQRAHEPPSRPVVIGDEVIRPGNR